jgi:hypothetical protein
MSNTEMPKIEKGLKFQLKHGADRTIFTVHSIINDVVRVTWPERKCEMAKYDLSSIRLSFTMGTYITVYDPSPTSEDKEQTVIFSEETIKKINEAADKYSFVVPYDGTNNFYDEPTFKNFIDGAKFGYRLAASQPAAKEATHTIKVVDNIQMLDINEATQKEAIEFGEWLRDNCDLSGWGYWLWSCNQMSEAELYAMFKQEKKNI